MLRGTTNNSEGGEFAEQRRRMVEGQLRRRGIADERVLTAMGKVPREQFIPEHQRRFAYDDSALSIGEGQTISQPYMVAKMLELLACRPEHRVLEVGAGSGYQAALLGELAAEVYAIEIVETLAESARQVLSRLGYENVSIVVGDGTLGYAEAAPYDRVIVAAAAPQLPPPLAEQLAEGGRLVAPVGSRGVQTCTIASKEDGELHIEKSIGCVFVPLIGQHGW